LAEKTEGQWVALKAVKMGLAWVSPKAGPRGKRMVVLMVARKENYLAGRMG
jgi:hypothetical protein